MSKRQVSSTWSAAIYKAKIVSSGNVALHVGTRECRRLRVRYLAIFMCPHLVLLAIPSSKQYQIRACCDRTLREYVTRLLVIHSITALVSCKCLKISDRVRSSYGQKSRFMPRFCPTHTVRTARHQIFSRIANPKILSFLQQCLIGRH